MNLGMQPNVGGGEHAQVWLFWAIGFPFVTATLGGV